MKQLRDGEAVQRAKQLARAVRDKDKQLAGMRVQLDRARKEAAMEHTRPHLALVKRKHEELSANNAAKKIGAFLDAAVGRAKDDAEGAKLQRHVAAKLTGRYQPRATSGVLCYGPCCRDALTAALSSSRAVREWKDYAKEELGVEHQVLEGKIVTAAIPIGMALANRIWGVKWSG
eukprot:jgi/Tetstr1/437798/TSEL_002837.t1